jgi:hypothetical protein
MILEDAPGSSQDHPGRGPQRSLLSSGYLLGKRRAEGVEEWLADEFDRGLISRADP